MGFRNGAYATIWGEVKHVSDTCTQGRISISKKNKQTGEYEQEFGGFVRFVGTATARKAMSLKERDRIKLGDVDVSCRYDKEKNTTYTNFTVFSFELPNESKNEPAPKKEPEKTVDDGELEANDLPF